MGIHNIEVLKPDGFDSEIYIPPEESVTYDSFLTSEIVGPKPDFEDGGNAGKVNSRDLPFTMGSKIQANENILIHGAKIWRPTTPEIGEWFNPSEDTIMTIAFGPWLEYDAYPSVVKTIDYPTVWEQPSQWVEYLFDEPQQVTSGASVAVSIQAEPPAEGHHIWIAYTEDWESGRLPFDVYPNQESINGLFHADGHPAVYAWSTAWLGGNIAEDRFYWIDPIVSLDT